MSGTLYYLIPDSMQEAIDQGYDRLLGTIKEASSRGVPLATSRTFLNPNQIEIEGYIFAKCGYASYSMGVHPPNPEKVLDLIGSIAKDLSGQWEGEHVLVMVYELSVCRITFEDREETSRQELDIASWV